MATLSCALTDIVSRFLLVFLSIEMILEETTIYQRRQKLRAVQNGLDLGSVYEATLGRIKAQGGGKARLGMGVLMWISHSRRPLQVDELRHALAIQIGSSDLSSDNIPAISTLLGCCQGLVIVDKSASIVRLIHFTLQEYLCAHPDLFDEAHSTMAETCLTYLNFQRIKGLSAGPSPDLLRVPFLEYSSLYWGIHMRIEPSDRAERFALQFLDQFDSHISAKFLWNSTSGELFGRYIPARGFSALHCISYFGIVEIAEILIKTNRQDVNQRDGADMTPFIWAARYGHEEVVRLLLRKNGIQPDQHDAKYGQTALSWAAQNGYEGIVKMLLERGDVNPNSLDKAGRAPVVWAARNSHEGTVKMLLGREDVDPDIPDTESNSTALLWAAYNGHEGVVKLLLGRKDVNPNTLTNAGRPPVMWATRNGHEGIVKLLLAWEDVNPDIQDAEHGATALSWAAENGYEGIVKLLLERGDVNPNSLNKAGQTPIMCAIQNNHEEIVKMLLGREDVDPDISDTM